MNNLVLSASQILQFSRAVTETWTRDLFLTKEVLYHWAITAALSIRAENGAQTRDPQLGRLVLYQLSYFRIARIGLALLRSGLHSIPQSNFYWSGWWWIRTTEVERQQIYSLPHLAALETTLVVNRLVFGEPYDSIGFRRSEPLVGFEPTTPRLQITCSGQLS